MTLLEVVEEILKNKQVKAKCCFGTIEWNDNVKEKPYAGGIVWSQTKDTVLLLNSELIATWELIIPEPDPLSFEDAYILWNEGNGNYKTEIGMKVQMKSCVSGAVFTYNLRGSTENEIKGKWRIIYE